MYAEEIGASVGVTEDCSKIMTRSPQYAYNGGQRTSTICRKAIGLPEGSYFVLGRLSSYTAKVQMHVTNRGGRHVF